jgi:acyl-CoA synthetase (AMP-forming)/AMP-acid ligase II
VGEIWVQSPTNAKGYWKNPEESARTFDARLSTGEGPFLRTGDLGFIHDQQLYICGRIKDLIIINGRNHIPTDLELTAERAHRNVRPNACAAFSVDTDGEERLVIVAEAERRSEQRNLKEAATPPADVEIAGAVPRREPWNDPSGHRVPLDLNECVAAVRQAISEHHQLQAHDVVLIKPGHMPKTSSGKIQRRACKALYTQGKLETLE